MLSASSSQTTSVWCAGMMEAQLTLRAASESEQLLGRALRFYQSQFVRTKVFGNDSRVTQVH